MSSKPSRDHYQPVTYLKAWCSADGELWCCHVDEKRRAGRFRCGPIGPKGIGYKQGLNTLPPRLVAGQLAGGELEKLLAEGPDNDFPALRTRISAVRGLITDAALLAEAKKLIAGFAARHPRSLGRAERGGAAFQDEHRTKVEDWRAMAQTDKGRAALDALLDPHDPARQARAAVLALAVTGDVAPGGALLGDVHVVHAADVQDALAAVDVDHFVTHDPTVVGWKANAAGLAMSFALSDERLLLVYEQGQPVDHAAYVAAVLAHTLNPLASSQMLITRSEPRGRLRKAAERELATAIP